MNHGTQLSRRLTLIAGAAFALSTAQLATGLLSGCNSTTGGQRLTLATRVVAAEGIEKPFENAYGWSVKLTKARVSIGELYYFSGAPVIASRPPPPRHPLSDYLIPSAHAHPGHYVEGDALGQMLSPRTVDLLKETHLAEAEAVTGHYESARFSFASPPEGDLAGEMEGHVVWVEGEATKADQTLLFRLTADEDDVLNADNNPFVEGCVFEAADIDADGTVTLTIHPSVWFDQVEFDKVEVDPDGGHVDLKPGEAPHKAFTRGLKKGTAYDFAYAP